MVLERAPHTVQLASKAIFALQNGFVSLTAGTKCRSREIAKAVVGQKTVDVFLAMWKPVLNWARLRIQVSLIDGDNNKYIPGLSSSQLERTLPPLPAQAHPCRRRRRRQVCREGREGQYHAGQ